MVFTNTENELVFANVDSGYISLITSSSVCINPISNPIHELIGVKEAIGADVASTMNDSFSRDTTHASVKGRIEDPATSVLE